MEKCNSVNYIQITLNDNEEFVRYSIAKFSCNMKLKDQSIVSDECKNKNISEILDLDFNVIKGKHNEINEIDSYLIDFHLFAIQLVLSEYSGMDKISTDFDVKIDEVINNGSEIIIKAFLINLKYEFTKNCHSKSSHGGCQKSCSKKCC